MKIYPYQKYLYFLLLQKKKEQEIFEDLDSRDLFFDPKDLPVIKEEFKKLPEIKSIKKATLKEFYKILEIDYENIPKLDRLFECPGAKNRLDILCFIEKNNSTIVDALNEKYSLLFLTEQLVDLYKDVFWNIDIGHDNWKKYYDKMPVSHRRRLMMELMKTSGKESIKRAIGVETGTDYKDMLKKILDASYQKYLSLLESPVISLDQLNKWITNILRAGDRYQKLKTDKMGADEIRKQLQFDLFEPKIPFLENFYSDQNLKDFEEADV